MQVSFNWLKDYVAVAANVHEVAERLTMTLNEVDEVADISHLKDFVVGEIVELEAHPRADRLWLTRVAVGESTRAIVCGADNLSVGDKVPVALPGITLPGGLTVEKRQIRGVESEGMLCSARELGIGDDHQGIWLLPADATIGFPLSKVLGSSHDSFELEVLANRPDCMGHLGIAREVAAAWQLALKGPKLKTPATSKAGKYAVSISKDAACTRYTLAHLSGLKNQSSPVWLKERLTSVGLRPVSAIVDVTNFVLLECGQPLHAFDADKLSGVKISVRQSRAKEGLQTLDGKKREIPSGTTMIADGKRAVAIAGIMGGAESEVTDQTVEVVLESAHFTAAPIRHSSRRLGLRSEASARYERGITEAMTMPALRRAVDLLLEICGGKLEQLTDAYPKLSKPTAVTIKPAELNSFIGSQLSLPQIKQPLTRLGFTVNGNTSSLKVTVPYWRGDVSREVDIYEEVARLHGYDALPSSLPQAALVVPRYPATHHLAERIRDVLAAGGSTEIVTHSLVGGNLVNKAGGDTAEMVEMANPLSEDHRYLRSALQPRHLEAVTANLRWRDELNLFEIGTVFETRKVQPKESKRLLITLASRAREDRFASIRGTLEYLFKSLKISDNHIQFLSTENEQHVPGRSFAILADDIYLGYLAETRYAKAFKAGRVYFCELDLACLDTILPTSNQIDLVPTLPPVHRDLSVFMPDECTYADLRKAILHAQSEVAVSQPREFVKDGQRSLTVHLEFRGRETLTDEFVTERMQILGKALVRQNYHIRD